MERLAESFEDAKKNTEALCEKVDAATRKADGIISEVTDAAKREIASLNTQCEILRKEKNNLSAGIIYDKDFAEAVKVYKAVLLATKDVFGENMDVETKIAAINAGSYIAWRGMPEQKEFIKKKPL
jgi:ABC-type phosphate transport system auxiliary subunit